MMRNKETLLSLVWLGVKAGTNDCGRNNNASMSALA